MKVIIPVHLAAAAVFMLLFFSSFAQNATKYKGTIYTFIVNKVPDHFPAPLVGFVNMAQGSQTGAQIGFLNQNQKNINGTQIGFVNNVGGYFNGSQIGFVNLSRKYVSGVQTGFVNLCNDSFTGAQIGFVNVVKDSMVGTQIGFVNAATKGLKGIQFGFVNISKNGIAGSQIGFVNIADSMRQGIPLGFVSIVRKGGFSAFEIGTSTLFLSTLSYKIGIPTLYTSVILSFNPSYTNQFAYGIGLGSMIRLNKTFGFNPEATIQNSMEQHTQMFSTLASCFSIRITPKTLLVAGPSVSWIHKDSRSGETLYKPAYSLYHYSYNYRNDLTVGTQVSLRFKLN